MVDKALDYVLLPRRMLGILLDVKVWRGEGGGIVCPFFDGSLMGVTGDTLCVTWGLS